MSEDLISKLNGADSTDAIKALQYLATNQTYASEPEIAACIKKLTSSADIGIRFWAKKLSNSIGRYETAQANAQVAAISKDLPVDILIQKLQSVASTYLSLDVIKKLCESKKPEALDFLKTYLSSCKDNIQISYLTKNIGIYFPSEENLLHLMPYLKHEDDRIVANTIEGIEAIGSPKGVVILSQLLEHKSNRVRTNAAIALGKFDAEKSFAVISKMLSPESGSHFRISACHAIKTLRDPSFLNHLEPALLDDTTFSAALASIEAIGGQPAIALLTRNYSRISASKQSQVDSIAAKLTRFEEKPLEKLSAKIRESEACAKASVIVEECGERLQKKINSARQSYQDAKSYFTGHRLLTAIVATAILGIAAFYFFPLQSAIISTPTPIPTPPTPTPRSSIPAEDEYTQLRNLLPLSYSNAQVEEVLRDTTQSPFHKNKDRNKQLTMAQKKEELRLIEGKWLLLIGKVESVKETAPSSYAVKCNVTYVAFQNCRYEVVKTDYFYYFDTEKVIAINLNMGSEIVLIGKVFRGAVQSVSFDFMGTTVEYYPSEIYLKESVLPLEPFNAISNANINYLKHLLGSLKYNPNAVWEGETLVHRAAKSNNPESQNMIQLLLDFGANVNAQGKDTLTALDIAIELGNKELVNFIASKGGKTSYPSEYGQVEGTEQWTCLQRIATIEAAVQLSDRENLKDDEFISKIVKGESSFSRGPIRKPSKDCYYMNQQSLASGGRILCRKHGSIDQPRSESEIAEQGLLPLPRW